MKILIDTSLLIPSQNNGQSIFSKSILNKLCKLDYQIILIPNKYNRKYLEKLRNKNCTIYNKYLSIDQLKYPLSPYQKWLKRCGILFPYRQIFLTEASNTIKADVFFSLGTTVPYRNSNLKKIICTIHDISLIKRPHDADLNNFSVNHQLKETIFSIYNSNTIFVPTNSIKRDIEENFMLPNKLIIKPIGEGPQIFPKVGIESL